MQVEPFSKIQRTELFESIHLQEALYPGQGHGGSGVYPRNTGHEAGIDPDGDTSPSQSTKATHLHLIYICLFGRCFKPQYLKKMLSKYK